MNILYRTMYAMSLFVGTIPIFMTMIFSDNRVLLLLLISVPITVFLFNIVNMIKDD